MKKHLLLFLFCIPFSGFTQNNYTITTSGLSFTPDTINCYVGDSITFILGASHNAVEVNQFFFNTGGTTSNGGFNIGLGQTQTIVISNAQSYYYVCQPHAFVGMKGVIIANTPPQPITYVPDDNFEQALIALGYDSILDDYVLTSNINTVAFLDVPNQNITDLTGIEDFISLTNLQCHDNQLTTLDVSANTALTYLNCDYNQLTNLDVSTNTALTTLQCDFNQLTSLDVEYETLVFIVYIPAFMGE